jgi:hypothetical protein
MFWLVTAIEHIRGSVIPIDGYGTMAKLRFAGKSKGKIGEKSALVSFCNHESHMKSPWIESNLPG